MLQLTGKFRKLSLNPECTFNHRSNAGQLQDKTGLGNSESGLPLWRLLLLLSSLCHNSALHSLFSQPGTLRSLPELSAHD